MPLKIALLDSTVRREHFLSGSPALDRYIQQQATQDIRRRVSACFVALDDEGILHGYYTLACASVLLDELPAGIQKKLPRYAAVPAVRMGRLAVSKTSQGKGLGSALLADALVRASHSEITAYALIVDAKDQDAARFYEHHGFITLSNHPLQLFLPLATVSSLVNKQQRLNR